MARYLPNAKNSSFHGKAFNIRGFLVVPMFHPAAALHQPSLKTAVMEDFAQLPGLIAQAMKNLPPEIKAEPAPETRPVPKQLNFF
jgi:DNA polymerase